jgi:DNA-binding transcriptional ArsR family regulator
MVGDAHASASIRMTKPQRTPQKTKPKRGDRASARSASDIASSAGDQAAITSRPRRALVTDPRAMRALAHPLRVALLDTLRRDGDITASRAGELLGESPGNMSWHLQTLAKYGFVEETGDGRGRSRPWRLASDSRSFDTGMTDPETAAAGEALERTFVERAYGQLREWWSRRLTYPLKWRRAAFMTDSVRYLTSQELTAIMDEIIAIYDRYADRDDAQKRPAGALPVHLFAHGHPLLPTPSGN